MKIKKLPIFNIQLFNQIKFNTGLPNFIFNISNYINKNYIDNHTNLHRWCHVKSDKYRYTCNWETKLDNANKDNSL